MQMNALSTMSSIGGHVNGDGAAGHSTSLRTNAALPTAPTVATAVRPSVPNAPFDRASDTVMQNAAYLAAMSAHGVPHQGRRRVGRHRLLGRGGDRPAHVRPSVRCRHRRRRRPPVPTGRLCQEAHSPEYVS